MKSYGYCEICSTDVLNYVASIFARGDAKEWTFAPGPAHVPEDRPGPRALPRHRPRPDPAEPAEVHLAGRADRARRGRTSSSIPIPQIDIPHFRFGDKQQGGVGQGDGDPGDPLGRASRAATGAGKAGERAGEHAARGRRHARRARRRSSARSCSSRASRTRARAHHRAKDRYTGIRRVGPESLRHFKRTYRRR